MYDSYFGFREAPFSVTPNYRFFYANPVYQEALATLRYGIEAKKGLIVITGEVGTGKTTLLRKSMRNLEATIRSVFIFNPHHSFAGLLRVVLRDLGIATKKENRSTMLEKLNGYLIEQLNQGHIVSLLIDEAQNLSGEVLEGIRLLSNLETDNEKLLQIVLIGQPELERKLNRPSLRHLKQRVAHHRRLAPLEEQEVGPYIDLRLQAAGYEGEALFHPDAVERIALYSRGIPRLINIICDNLLLTAYADSKKKVTAAMTQEVASGLQLCAQIEEKIESPAMGVGTTEEKDQGWAASDEELGGLCQAVSKELEMQAGGFIRHQWVVRGLLLALLILSGAGAALYSQLNSENFIGIRGENLAQPKHGIETLKEEASDEVAHVETPALQDSALLTKDLNQHASSLSSTQKSSTSQASAPTAATPAPESANKPPEEIMTAPDRRARIQTSNDPVIQRQRTRLQIYKAIQNRAIAGVEVSFIGSTAYLDGRVATERQKYAAEQAARSVPKVKDIRNRIVVNPAAGEKEGSSAVR